MAGNVQAEVPMDVDPPENAMIFQVALVPYNPLRQQRRLAQAFLLAPILPPPLVRQHAAFDFQFNGNEDVEMNIVG